MGDRGAERALALGALDIDMDPLPIARACGERIDASWPTVTRSETPSSCPTNSAAVVMV
jgi:hypothetical protein